MAPQAPVVEQGDAQQNLLMVPRHWPEAHWLFAVQAPPAPVSAMQVVPTQASPLMQSSWAPEQETGQAAPPLQTYGLHEGLPAPPSATLTQLPVAQVWQAPHEADPQQKPPTQLPLEHCVPEAQAVPFPCSTTQAFEPLQ